jgi:hypoxia up-regulated 1
MFFDMGASSTIATIVEYRTVQVKVGEKAEVVPQLTVKGVGYDRTLGGLEMDFRLRDHLLKEFIAQGKAKGDIRSSPRSMAKLLKEARRLKMVLSANTAHRSQIEGLFEDVDFSREVSRETFESLCSDLFGRIKGVVSDVLKNADMIMDEIQAVVLVGGGTRVPKVQEELMKETGRSELGKNLNTDEAIALGAVYQAAALGQGFKVKKFNVKEANVFPIEVSFERKLPQEEGSDEPPKMKRVERTLFGVSNPYPQKKVMTFNKMSTNFVFNVSYGGLATMSEMERRCLGPEDVMSVLVEEVEEALKKNSDGVSKGVKAHFEMNANGVLVLNSVEASFEKEVEEAVKEVEEEKSTFSSTSMLSVNS